MKITLEVLGRWKKQYDTRDGITISDIAMEIGIRKSEYIPVVNGEVVTWEYKLKPGDQVKLVPVVSGG